MSSVITAATVQTWASDLASSITVRIEAGDFVPDDLPTRSDGYKLVFEASQVYKIFNTDTTYNFGCIYSETAEGVLCVGARAALNDEECEPKAMWTSISNWDFV